MPGFPPPAAERWTLATWQLPPYNRTTFHSLREVVPTARVGRGTAEPQPLRPGPPWDPQRALRRGDGTDSTVAEVLATTYTDGFLVLCDGEVVVEEYPAGMGPDRTHVLMSVSKSVVGCVVAVLADRGAIDLEAPLTDHVPELARSGYQGATVRHLLDMRLGIHFSEDYLDGDAEVRLLEQVIGWAPRVRPDLPGSMYEYLCTLSGSGRHGGPFSYRSCETDVLGWVCERASGVRMPGLLSEGIRVSLSLSLAAKAACESAPPLYVSANHQAGTTWVPPTRPSSSSNWPKRPRSSAHRARTIALVERPEQDADAAVDPAGAVMHDGGLAVTLRDLWSSLAPDSTSWNISLPHQPPL